MAGAGGAGGVDSFASGPVIATVMPGRWMFTNSVEPSGETQAPASSVLLKPIWPIL